MVSTTTADVARLISAAADKFRGIKGAYDPTTQDLAAAESITAAYYLIPRTELPTVNPYAITASAPTVGTYTFSGKQDRDLTKIRKDLTSLAAWVDYLERTQAAAAQAAEETQDRRRQAVLAELLPDYPAADRNWDSLSHLSRLTIDRIIALEDGHL